MQKDSHKHMHTNTHTLTHLMAKYKHAGISLCVTFRPANGKVTKFIKIHMYVDGTAKTSSSSQKHYSFELKF